MFPKADFTVKSWTAPSTLSADFVRSLSTSPDYYVVTSVALKSEKPYIEEPLQFSISFEDRGKKSVEQPRIVVCFFDFVYRVWQIFNESVTNDVMTKECSIKYHFPSSDQKTIGSWGILVLLYDDAESVLVSHEAKQFVTTDVSPAPWWEIPLILFGFLVLIIVLRYGPDRLRRYFKKGRRVKST